jgi:hypothetical protein
VALCTALSQTANADDEYQGFYRPRRLEDVPRALALAGVRATSPVMAEQAHLFFEDDAAAVAGTARLESARTGGEPTFDVRRSGSDVIVGCRFLSRRPAGAMIDLPGGEQILFDELFYWTDAPREGTHHPDGIFWMALGEARARDVRVPLAAVAPTILSVLGVGPAASMHQRPLLVTAS